MKGEKPYTKWRLLADVKAVGGSIEKTVLRGPLRGETSNDAEIEADLLSVGDRQVLLSKEGIVRPDIEPAIRGFMAPRHAAVWLGLQ